MFERRPQTGNRKPRLEVSGKLGSKTLYCLSIVWCFSNITSFLEKKTLCGRFYNIIVLLLWEGGKKHILWSVGVLWEWFHVLYALWGAVPTPTTQKGLAEAISLNVHILVPDLQYTLALAQLKRAQVPGLLEAMVVGEFFEKLFSDLFFAFI